MGGLPGAADLESGNAAADPEKAANVLPCALLRDIEPIGARRWLIDGIWAGQAVGVLGGPPKVGKSWLALELALAVASGRPALGAFPVPIPGPVLMFSAEDSPGAVRERIDGLCRARGADLSTLPLHVITAESVKLDADADRTGLEAVLGEIRPKLLVLDPFVRLHSGDENYAGHVADLLGYLRCLERRFSLAIMIAHHVSKKSHVHPGQALRGSSDLHGWGDSNLYLQRQEGGSVLLTIEHRGAPAPEPISLRLMSQPGGGAHFEIVWETDGGGETRVRPEPLRAPLAEEILRILKESGRPVSQVFLRKRLGVRNARLTEMLRKLASDGRVRNLGQMGGWEMVRDESSAGECGGGV